MLLSTKNLISMTTLLFLVITFFQEAAESMTVVKQRYLLQNLREQLVEERKQHVSILFPS